jgi:putative flippase GtrA
LNPVAQNRTVRVVTGELFRIARFGLVGVSSTLCYAAVAFLVVWSSIGSSIPATIVGHFAAALVSYYGHLYFSFQVEPNHRRFAWRFLLVATATFGINLLLTWSLVSVFYAPYQVPIAVVTIVLPAASYLVNRLWVFHDGPPGAPAQYGVTD